MSLLGLPTELIAHVFKSVDNIRFAAALGQTSRHLHSVWRHNLPSICDRVLPREIECYDQAYQLLEARAQSDTVIGDSSLSIEENADAAVLRVRVLFTIAENAYKALEWFDVELTCTIFMTPEESEQPPRTCTCDPTDPDYQGWPTLKGVGRSRFMQGYYRVLSMIDLAGEKATRAYQFLASMHLLDFFRMLEVMDWMFFEYSGADMPHIHRTFPGYDSRPRDAGLDALDEYLYDVLECYEFLQHLDSDLSILSGIEKPFNWRDWRLGTSYHLILHEDCLDHSMRKAESIALADLLPRLPKNSPFSSGYEVMPPK